MLKINGIRTHLGLANAGKNTVSVWAESEILMLLDLESGQTHTLLEWARKTMIHMLSVWASVTPMLSDLANEILMLLGWAKGIHTLSVWASATLMLSVWENDQLTKYHVL